MTGARTPTGRPGPTAPRNVVTMRSPRWELCVEQEAGERADRRVTLDGELFRIGSHESNDLVITDPLVSGFHCSIQRGRSAWKIIDHESLNGTRIAGVRLRDADLPTPECLLELGDTRVRLRELAAEVDLELLDQPNYGELYGTSVPMRQLFATMEKLAASDRTVLIEGESGTGKERVAAEITRRGARANKPFIVVDCGAISPTLIESELFGHTRGAFTGADRERIGAFEAALDGTVFLDEIGELPLDMQPKLLRVLEAREFRRVGETKPRRVEARIIAATNRRLEREVNQGRFREDLYFRISVVTLRLPPLRDRVEDIELLLRVFLAAEDAADSAQIFTPALIEGMKRHSWPGNVRELRNFVDRALILRDPAPPGVDAVEASPVAGTGKSELELPFRHAKERVIADFERRYLTALLAAAQGNVSRAARKAGMDRMNLHRLVQRYGLRSSGSVE